MKCPDCGAIVLEELDPGEPKVSYSCTKCPWSRIVELDKEELVC